MALHRPKTILRSSMKRTTTKKEEDILWIEDNFMDSCLSRIEKNKIEMALSGLKSFGSTSMQTWPSEDILFMEDPKKIIYLLKVFYEEKTF